MTKEFDLDVEQDPELLDADAEGDESKYDGEAVASVPFDDSQFELPDDFEVEDDENG